MDCERRICSRAANFSFSYFGMCTLHTIFADFLYEWPLLPQSLLAIMWLH